MRLETESRGCPCSSRLDEEGVREREAHILFEARDLAFERLDLCEGLVVRSELFRSKIQV